MSSGPGMYMLCLVGLNVYATSSGPGKQVVLVPEAIVVMLDQK